MVPDLDGPSTAQVDITRPEGPAWCALEVIRFVRLHFEQSPGRHDGDGRTGVHTDACSPWLSYRHENTVISSVSSAVNKLEQRGARY